MTASFPDHKQKVDSYTCGSSCIQNILEYYNIEKSLDTILKEIGVGEKESTHVPQLALYIKNLGFEAKILSSCPNNFSPDWKGESKDQQILLIKKWITHNLNDIWLKDTLFLQYYLEAGGDFEQLDLSTKIIDKYLDQKYLVLACLDETWIWEKRKKANVAEYDSIVGHTNGHFVVVYDQDKDDYLISDPYPTNLPGKEGLYRVSKNKLLVSILIWAKQLIVLKK